MSWSHNFRILIALNFDKGKVLSTGVIWYVNNLCNFTTAVEKSTLTSSLVAYLNYPNLWWNTQGSSRIQFWSLSAEYGRKSTSRVLIWLMCPLPCWRQRWTGWSGSRVVLWMADHTEQQTVDILTAAAASSRWRYLDLRCGDVDGNEVSVLQQ